MAHREAVRGVHTIRAKRPEADNLHPQPERMKNPFRYFKPLPEIIRPAVMMYIR